MTKKNRAKYEEAMNRAWREHMRKTLRIIIDSFCDHKNDEERMSTLLGLELKLTADGRVHMDVREKGKSK